MTIPEITREQIKTLNELTRTGLVIVVLPDSSKDNPSLYEAISQTIANLRALEKMGLIEDTTQKYTEKLAIIRRENNREARAFELTKLGENFFLAFTSSYVN